VNSPLAVANPERVADAYRTMIAAAPERIPAGVLPRELRERGYTGGYTMLKALVASLKPKEAAAPIVRFETEPGEQMQVGWPPRSVNGKKP
jgi:transposase